MTIANKIILASALALLVGVAMASHGGGCLVFDDDDDSADMQKEEPESEYPWEK